MTNLLMTILAATSLGAFPQAYPSSATYKNHVVDILKIEQALHPDLASLEGRINNFIKEKPGLAGMEGLRQFHLPMLIIDTAEIRAFKNDGSDSDFLFHVITAYFSLNNNSIFLKKRSYIDAHTLITDSCGNLVATGNPFWVHVAPVKDSDDIKLARMLFDREFYFIFLISTGSYRYSVAIKGKELYGIAFPWREQKEMKIYPWKEFIEYHFYK